MFDQEYKCPNCGELHLLMVIDPVKSFRDDYCDWCNHEGLESIDNSEQED